MKFEKYTLKSGKVKWSFYHYLGVDPDTGKRLEVSRRGFNTQAEARAALLKIISEYEESSILVQARDGRMRFKEVTEQWLIYYKTQVKITTYTNRKILIDNHIYPFFKDKFIGRIDVMMCQKAVNHWYSNYSEATRLVNIVSQIFKFGINQGFCREDPMSKIMRPKNTHKENYEPAFYEKDELQKFLMAVHEDESLRAYTMFHTLAFTGLRRGELFALQWKDINFDKQTLSVKHNLIFNDETKEFELSTLKTSSSERTLSIDDATTRILFKWRSYQREFFIGQGINTNSPEQLVFTSLNNHFMTDSYLRRISKRVAEKSKLHYVTVHGFRHTHCSLLFEAGVDMHNVKDRLGHSDIQTTLNIYTHVTKTERDKTGDLFGDFMDTNFS